jgi:signal transduction histidine kinase
MTACTDPPCLDDDWRALQHELRTPLNAVLGFAQLIKHTQRDRMPDRVLRWVEQIEFAGQHMLQLVELPGATAWQRQTAPPGPVRPTSDLLRAVQGAIRMTRLAAVHAGVAVTLHADVERPIVVVGSEVAHRQVLINLLSNAIKYSARGTRVSIEVEAPRDGSDAHATVAVRDHGIGMSAEQIARLFVPYERLGRGAGGTSGSGLGLYLTRQLVAGVGGDMHVASRVAEGTTVTVRVPMAPC